MDSGVRVYFCRRQGFVSRHSHHSVGDLISFNLIGVAWLGNVQTQRFRLTRQAAATARTRRLALQLIGCLVEAGHAALACDTFRDADRNGFFLGVYRVPRHRREAPHDFLALGIAPVWAKTVTLKAGKISREIRVRDGAYAMKSSDPITLVNLQR